MIQKRRLPFLILAIASLFLGLNAGLARIGWDIHVPPSPHHGAIMVGCFLGSIISLEKVIPLKKQALYVIPLLAAFSAVLFVFNQPYYGYITLVSSSVGLSAVFLFYLSRERTMIYLLMMIGALCWLAGNLTLLATYSYPSSVPWWMAFALLIIGAERIELMKFLPVSSVNKKVFASLLLMFALASLLSFHGTGAIISGVLLILISLWLLKHDLIGISIRKNGLIRYVACALLSGYFALLLVGILLITLNSQLYGYDVVVHVYFIGFVFAMIFAHGPIIIPGVLGISMKPYNRILYLWVVLLILSWMMRIGGGVLLDVEIRKVSGLISAFAISGYFLSIAYLVSRNNSVHAKIF